MSAIVDCTDQQPSELLKDMAAGPAERAFKPSHRWKVLGIGVAANASFSATFSGIPATAVVLRQGYHLSNAELGMALGLLGLGVALSELPWGLLTDRWGDRRVLLIGLGATAAWLFVMAMLVVPTRTAIPGITLLSASLLFTGLLGGSVNGSSGRAIMAWFRESERGFAMSIRQTAVPLGGGLGALVLPSLALAFGFAAVFGVLAGASALSALFAWRWLHEPPMEREGVVVAAAVAGPAPLRNIEVWRIATAIGLLCFPQVAVLTFASVFLHDFVGLGTAAISASLAAVQIGAMVMRVWSGRFTDRHGNRRQFLRTCSALSALAFVVLWLLVLASPAMSGRPVLPDGDPPRGADCGGHLGLRLARRRLHRACHAGRRRPCRNRAQPCQQLRFRRLLPRACGHSGAPALLVMARRLAVGRCLRADCLADLPAAGLSEHAGRKTARLRNHDP